jgi:hypothetical protein
MAFCLTRVAVIVWKVNLEKYRHWPAGGPTSVSRQVADVKDWSVVICSVIMSSFFDKILDQGKEILQDPSKINSYVEDPSKLLNVGLNFIGQDGE